MDASSRSERLRNMTLAVFHSTNLPQDEQQDEKTAEVCQNRMKGGIELAAANVQPASPTTQLPTISQITIQTLDRVLQYAASANIGPTRCARLMYIWFAGITMGWNWITTSGPLSGIKDGWDWSAHTPASNINSQLLWMKNVLKYVSNKFVPGFDGSFLNANVPTNGNWSGWQAAFDAWADQRNNDGHIAAVVAPTDNELPNGSIKLDVSDTVDPSTYPQPNHWTPLIVQGKTKSYLTYKWQTVYSSCLDARDEKDISGVATAYFPKTQAKRNAEIAEVLEITESLTDDQKIIAEFWAGGPGTASPPGMFVWMWKECMKVMDIEGDAFFYSGLELAINLFEASRIVWGLKLQYTQARPIQEIRRNYRGQMRTNYDGTPIAGESWVPYQEANFVTPPFPDFPSGHSAFSQCFASVMTRRLGSRMPTTGNSLRNDVALLCPILETQTQPYGSFTFAPGASNIQPGIVPSAPTILRWECWQDVANSAGISRKYGGIHATSAHTSSQILARRLFEKVRSRWGFK